MGDIGQNEQGVALDEDEFPAVPNDMSFPGPTELDLRMAMLVERQGLAGADRGHAAGQAVGGRAIPENSILNRARCLPSQCSTSSSTFRNSR